MPDTNRGAHLTPLGTSSHLKKMVTTLPASQGHKLGMWIKWYNVTDNAQSTQVRNTFTFCHLTAVRPILLVTHSHTLAYWSSQIRLLYFSTDEKARCQEYKWLPEEANSRIQVAWLTIQCYFNYFSADFHTDLLEESNFLAYLRKNPKNKEYLPARLLALCSFPYTLRYRWSNNLIISKESKGRQTLLS